jgi:hypothetical protein
MRVVDVSAGAQDTLPPGAIGDSIDACREGGGDGGVDNVVTQVECGLRALTECLLPERGSSKQAPHHPLTGTFRSAQSVMVHLRGGNCQGGT